MASPRSRALGACLLALLALARTARADESVTTRRGDLYRGEIVERVVGDHVTLKLATGEIRRIAWADLAEPAAPPPPPVAPGAPLPPAVTVAPRGAPLAPPAPIVGRRVDFHADAQGAELQRINATGTVDVDHVTPMGVPVWTSQAQSFLYTPICPAPCVATVDPTQRYRIAGPGLRTSSTFSLRSPTNTIDARMGSNTKRNAGRALTLFVGVPLTVVGALLLPAGAASSSRVSCEGCVDMKDSFFLWGGIIGGLGLVSLITGGTLWGTSETRVTVNGFEGAAERRTRVSLRPDGLHF